MFPTTPGNSVSEKNVPPFLLQTSLKYILQIESQNQLSDKALCILSYLFSLFLNGLLTSNNGDYI